jgi:hypothetical protein
MFKKNLSKKEANMTPNQIINELEDINTKLLKGKIDAKTANTLIKLNNLKLKCFEKKNISSRLDIIDKVTKKSLNLETNKKAELVFELIKGFLENQNYDDVDNITKQIGAIADSIPRNEFNEYLKKVGELKSNYFLNKIFDLEETIAYLSLCTVILSRFIKEKINDFPILPLSKKLYDELAEYYTDIMKEELNYREYLNNNLKYHLTNPKLHTINERKKEFSK